MREPVTTISSTWTAFAPEVSEGGPVSGCSASAAAAARANTRAVATASPTELRILNELLTISPPDTYPMSPSE